MYNDFRFKNAAVEERRGVEDFYKQSGNFHGYSDTPSSGLKEISDEKLSHSSFAENKETLAKSPPGHLGETTINITAATVFYLNCSAEDFFPEEAFLAEGSPDFSGECRRTIWFSLWSFF